VRQRPVSVTLENVGGDLLTVDSFALVDPSGAFVVPSPPAVPFSLAPGQTLDVGVLYTPSAVGAGSAQVVVGSNDPDGDESADLVAAGVQVGRSELYEVPADPPLDVVFAVDQSGSMDSHTDEMTAALDDFVLGLAGVTADWRIGVVTFDDGCFNTWFDANTPNYQALFEDAADDGTQTNPDNVDTERLFTVAGRTLVQFGPGGCNAAFRRPDGFLHVILVSDENEQSHDPDELRPPYDTIPGALGVYHNYVDSPGMLTVSVVANLQNTCQNQSDAIAQGADRYIAMAQATGGLELDICEGTWGAQMADLGASPASEHRIPLAYSPDPASIAVTVDGVRLTAGWIWDGAEVVVQVPLAPGAQIEVTYLELPVCAP
jgi:hypothetical protein